MFVEKVNGLEYFKKYNWSISGRKNILDASETLIYNQWLILKDFFVCFLFVALFVFFFFVLFFVTQSYSERGKKKRESVGILPVEMKTKSTSAV